MKLRKKIRKYINEALGIQMDLKRITERIVPYVENYIYDSVKLSDTISVRPAEDIAFKFDLTGVDLENTGIELINIILNFYENNKNTIGGSYKSDKTKLNLSGFFSIDIELKFNFSREELKNIKSRKVEIESVVSHELHHAFVDIKKYGRKSASKELNSVNNFMKFGYPKTTPLGKFSEMVYLSLPEEIYARVQEVSHILDKLENGLGYQKIISELYKFHSINDARRMHQYDMDEVRNLSKEELLNYIKTFYRKLKKNIPDNELKNPIEFFEKFYIKIHRAGYELNNRILKLVADKFQMKEEDVHNGISITEIFGDLPY